MTFYRFFLLCRFHGVALARSLWGKARSIFQGPYDWLILMPFSGIFFLALAAPRKVVPPSTGMPALLVELGCSVFDSGIVPLAGLGLELYAVVALYLLGVWAVKRPEDSFKDALGKMPRWADISAKTLMAGALFSNPVFLLVGSVPFLLAFVLGDLIRLLSKPSTAWKFFRILGGAIFFALVEVAKTFFLTVVNTPGWARKGVCHIREQSAVFLASEEMARLEKSALESALPPSKIPGRHRRL